MKWSRRHVLDTDDWSRDEIETVLDQTRAMVEILQRPIRRAPPLRGRTVILFFAEASTRTRVSFEAGMNQLGGIAINLNRGDTQLSRGEPIEDVARVISRMVDVVMIRTFEQAIIERFAEHSRVPVINGLTNEYHPCQILADLYTYVEHRGSIAGRTVAWIGDVNNVCATWLQAAAIFDFTVRVSAPPGYRTPVAASDAQRCVPFDDPYAACDGVDLVTTDVWTSMGFEAENEVRKRAFGNWQVTADMMRRARPDALFMHCLPAHRGEEVAADVIDSPQSVVWDEAENRLHAQKALLEYLVCGHVTG